MANDKLFRKRKERAAKDMARRRDALSPYDKVLIVCEGAKTEKYYFDELAKSYDINSHNIKIVGGGGSPTNIAKMAETQYKAGKKDRIPFDKVYCVFDKNSHADYQRALAQLENKEDFEAIVSVPCFEYWLLLHYCDSAKPYEKRGSKSACDQVISELKTHIPRYEKGGKNIFSRVQENLDTAIANAKSTLKAAQKSGTDNPSTKVHLLVEYLQNISRPPRR